MLPMNSRVFLENQHRSQKGKPVHLVLNGAGIKGAIPKWNELQTRWISGPQLVQS
jgi:hypothetical protein